MRYSRKFEGIVNNLERRYKQTNSEGAREDIEKYMSKVICPECNGFKLQKESLQVKIANKNIIDLFSFCGNNFMYHKLPKNERENVAPYLWHHKNCEYEQFEEYLINYLNL